MELNNTIFTVVCKKYIHECSITAITELSIVARMKEYEIEFFHAIKDKNKTWFDTIEEAEAYVEKQKQISEKIAQLEKELQ